MSDEFDASFIWDDAYAMWTEIRKGNYTPREWDNMFEAEQEQVTLSDILTALSQIAVVLAHIAHKLEADQ